MPACSMNAAAACRACAWAASGRMRGRAGHQTYLCYDEFQEIVQQSLAAPIKQAGDLGKADNPYWAVLACPSCGSLGLITRQQCAGLDAMICGSST